MTIVGFSTGSPLGSRAPMPHIKTWYVKDGEKILNIAKARILKIHVSRISKEQQHQPSLIKE
jgi:hypothetical protein